MKKRLEGQRVGGRAVLVFCTVHCSLRKVCHLGVGRGDVIKDEGRELYPFWVGAGLPEIFDDSRVGTGTGGGG